MMISRTPRAALRPFVKTVWLQDETAAPMRPIARERVLPTGAMHLVLRLTEHPLKLFDGVDAAAGHTVGCALIGGVRAGHYVRETGQPLRSVGAQLHPGAALALLGVPADELAERHTPLQDVWGREADRWRERLVEAPGPRRTLDLFEALLESRLAGVPAMHPAVAFALRGFQEHGDVGEVVERTGYSHRRFIALFTRAVGLTPKVYCRVLRLQRALPLLLRPEVALSEVALDAGYSDQAHLNRELLLFSGLTPGAFRALRPQHPHHAEARQVKFLQDPQRPLARGYAP
jgi:AraC-like DNA-binding protein